MNKKEPAPPRPIRHLVNFRGLPNAVPDSAACGAPWRCATNEPTMTECEPCLEAAGRTA